MSNVDTDLELALAAGPRSLIALGRTLVDARDDAKLLRASQQLVASAATTNLQWAAYYRVLARDYAGATELYRRWLEDAEAPAAFHLAQYCRALQRVGDNAGVFEAAARFHPWDIDYEAHEIAARALAKVRDAGIPDGFRTIRVALLATFNSQTLLASLRVGCARLGLDVELYAPDSDQLQIEIVDPSSGLYAHRPHVVILAACWRDLDERTAAQQANDWVQRWDLIRQRAGAHILQHTFDRAPVSALGHLEARLLDSRRRIAQDVNALLAQHAGNDVSLVDFEQVAFRVGARAFCDERQWYWAKEAVSAAAAPEVVEEYLAVLRPLFGRAYKVCVLDLDNTLWGGVVGEVGTGGLRVGPPSPDGEAFRDVQRYVHSLRRRGVLLAVCSKNNPEDAREPFERLPDMALALTDFVSFQASWEPKAMVVRRMAAELNLGLDSFVFVDDNPAERALMRRENPSVLTIPLPDDVSRYVEAIDRAHAFDALNVTEEDGQRTAQYQAEQQRKALQAEGLSLPEYYRSLEMKAALGKFTDAEATRVVQLASRSNQFNLTTWRITPADYANIASSPQFEARTIRLSDRFGDHGLVMVLIAEAQGTQLIVRAYFMSCRVIGRTLEELALAELEAIAKARGCTEIIGIFIPTKKNRALVAELYPRLGFERVAIDESETTTWRRVVPETPSINPYITIVRPEE